MLNRSSLGQRQHRSINVAANLLTERVEGMRKVGKESVGKLTLVGLVLATGLAVLPIAGNLRARVQAAATTSLEWRNGLAERRQEAESRLESTLPQAAEEELINYTTTSANFALGSLRQVLNSGGNSVLISEVNATISSGRMNLSLRCDAQDYSSLRQFVENANGGVRVDRAVLISTANGDLLGPDSIRFEFQKVVTFE